MNDVSLAQLAGEVDKTCRITGTFLLRSGQTSNHYFDKYLFESNPILLRSVAKALVPLVPSGTEILAGLEMGGIPVATALSLETGLPLIFVRKQAKDYGTCKLAEGCDFKGRRVTLVEDVVTTGGAIRDGAEALRKAGALIEPVLCVIDRESGGAEKLKELNLNLIPLFKASDFSRKN